MQLAQEAWEGLLRGGGLVRGADGGGEDIGGRSCETHEGCGGMGDVGGGDGWNRCKG